MTDIFCFDIVFVLPRFLLTFSLGVISLFIFHYTLCIIIIHEATRYENVCAYLSNSIRLARSNEGK